jgi:hypothetical protein
MRRKRSLQRFGFARQGPVAAEGIFIIFAFVWLGMLLGVSFLATPVKFQAHSLELAVALEVGRQTFQAFNRIELVLTVVLVAAGVVVLASPAMIGLVAILALSVLVQTFWLLPILDTRVETILVGGVPPASSLHILYIAIDCTKLLILSGLSISALRLMAAR